VDNFFCYDRFVVLIALQIIKNGVKAV